jgi:anti-sigma factor (TIGR02949 family)
MVKQRILQISCQHVWRELSNYIDGQVEHGLRLRMEAHFKSCQHCSAILDGTSNVVRLVGDGRTFDLPKGFRARLRTRLEAELPDQPADCD